MSKKELNYSKFPFLSSFPEPILVLALDAEKEWREPKFNKKYKFNPICHQVAGLGCHHKYLYIKRLEFKNKELLENAKLLHKLYYNTSLGCLGPHLDDLVEYRKNLKKLLGAGCNYTYKELQEAIYPIDIDYLGKMTKTRLPFNLDDLLVFNEKLESYVGSVGRWNLFILAENSD